MKDQLSYIEEQSLKSTRLAYNILVTLCFTSIIFTYSPENLGNIYKKAVNELNQQEEIDISFLIFQCAYRNPKFKKFYDDFSTFFYNSGFDHLTKNNDYLKIFQFELPNRLQAYRLEDIDYFYNRTYTIEISIIVMNENLKRDFKKFYDEDSHKFNDYGTFSNISLNKEGFSILFRTKNVSTLSTGFKTDVSTRETFNIEFFPLYEIYESNLYPEVVIKDKERFIFLPNVKKVWDQVRGESIEDSIKILARKDLPFENKLEFMGITIPQNLISWTVPVIIFSVSLYFFSHLSYLYKLVNSNPKISIYPWVAIMPGFLSSIVSSVTLLIIPGIALVFVIIAHWYNQSAIVTITMFVFSSASILVLACSFILCHKIKKFQKTLM